MQKGLKSWARGEEKRKALPYAERRALANLRREARAAGAVLAFDGVGGLPSSLALGVFRRDGFQCKVHGDRGEGENGGIQLHHKSGVLASRWLENKGHSNELNNLVTVCTRAHDEIHRKARAEGIDSSQVKSERDKERGE